MVYCSKPFSLAVILKNFISNKFVKVIQAMKHYNTLRNIIPLVMKSYITCRYGRLSIISHCENIKLVNVIIRSLSYIGSAVYSTVATWNNVITQSSHKEVYITKTWTVIYTPFLYLAIGQTNSSHDAIWKSVSSGIACCLFHETNAVSGCDMIRPHRRSLTKPHCQFVLT